MPEIPAVHCEAKKVAYRQTKDGLVVSFVIHPNDMPDALATAPLGQRYMLAMAAIGDDEQPVPVQGGAGASTEPAKPGDITWVEPGGLMPSAASQRGRERYRDAPPMQQALVRACRLSNDLRFQGFVAKDIGSPAHGGDAAMYIRVRCCEGKSRGLIGEDPDCYQRFLALETEYRAAVGLIAEVRS